MQTLDLASVHPPHFLTRQKWACVEAWRRNFISREAGGKLSPSSLGKRSFFASQNALVGSQGEKPQPPPGGDGEVVEAPQHTKGEKKDETTVDAVRGQQR